jgi:hypothetical protein
VVEFKRAVYQKALAELVRYLERQNAARPRRRSEERAAARGARAVVEERR